MTLHWIRRDGRAIPAGIDLRSFAFVYDDPDNPSVWTDVVPASDSDLGKAFYASHDAQPAGGWHEIRTSTLRAISVPKVVAESREHWARMWARHWTAQRWPKPEYDREPATRGPKPKIADDVVQSIVVPAHLSGGKRPVEAVRVALEDWKRAQGMEPHTTRDEAANLVRRARRQGWLNHPGKGRQ